MLNQIKQTLQSRQHSGRLLAEKLVSYRDEDAIVLAIPRGGVPVGLQLALSLGISFEIIFSKRIRHPAHRDKSIGAVSLDEVFLHETQFIPQDYVSHQINLLQNELREQFVRYHGANHVKTDCKNRTVILVDDVLRETDELMASILTLSKQSPKQIVIAAAVASLKAVNILLEENYEVHYLFMEFGQHNKAFSYFPEVNESETKGFPESETSQFTIL